MGRADGTDPALVDTPVPLEGDGHELLGMLIDGRYRLDATLGRGGMGLVYRAAHIGLRRQVAVKILHPSLAASPEVRNRFEREALAVGKIDHPHCVSVYDVGRLPDGALYLAMELLEGKALADVLEKEGQIAPGRALHILAGILQGLAHIHQARLIHRDIKPENIFLIRQGEDEDFAKILDFGIAKPMEASDLDDGVKLTQAGMAFGTPIYMAPEQALGNPIDGRADLYAAAVMGYEMLCGQPPFYSEDKLEVMSMHTARPVPPMRQRLVRGARPVPSSIERLIVRGLTKKPGDRYATAEEFQAAVEQALRTPDGGVTDVVFDRPGDTGSQPLVSDDGEVRITGANELMSEAIADAISDALSTPTSALHTAAPAREMGREPASTGGPAGATPRGGVGIGLPYTGPQGELIFGLLPEQRLAGSSVGFAAAKDSVIADTGVANALEPEPRTSTVVPHLRKRLGLYLVIAMCAIALGVVGAVITANASHGSAPVELDPQTPAGVANEALEHGDVARALQVLEANKAAIADDAGAQLVLGHVRASRNENELALAAYEQALKLSPELETNEKLRAALRTMAGSTQDYPVVAQAFNVWVARTSDPEAKKLLLLSAVHDDIARRKAVRPVIEARKLDDQVDWLQAYSLDLQQDPSCSGRREAVARLRALGDQRAVAALERTIASVEHAAGKPARPSKPNKPSKAVRVKKSHDCVTELAEDATAAIGYLQGLPQK
ncbi:MAG TPA: protein kinase [Kofleriaceae bacterium]|nr:protein kinase [Kofleriaceae bacterium]